MRAEEVIARGLQNYYTPLREVRRPDLPFEQLLCSTSPLILQRRAPSQLYNSVTVRREIKSWDRDNSLYAQMVKRLRSIIDFCLESLETRLDGMLN